MSEPPKVKKPKEDKEIPQMPFDDALRRILSARPQPKIAHQSKVKSKGGEKK